MPLTSNDVELVAQWCAQSETLAGIRAKAESDFFGYDEVATLKYMGGVGNLNARERRFLGWFAFYFCLPGGQHPAERAALALLNEADQDSALLSIRGARYILAVVLKVMSGKRIYLELQDEEFEVASGHMGQGLNKDDSLCAHILPAGRNRWILGPGWVIWPVRFGPDMRSNLKELQVNPIEVERFLQRRSKGKENAGTNFPTDTTFSNAVARMTEAAKAAGKDNLVRSPEEWKSLVLGYMQANNLSQFSRDIIQWVGELPSLYVLNRWLSLSSNIWNNVPQPDRRNRSTREIGTEEKAQDTTTESKNDNQH